jgi:thioesterase domain-containing protein
VEAANVQASRQFTPAAYPGLVILLSASQQPAGIVEDAALGWDKFEIGDLRVHQVEGHHGNLLMPPYVDQVREILEQVIER